jgi:hypothetical protein
VARHPRQQPFHEPIGLSPEGEEPSRRWILSLIVAVLVLVAGIVAWLRLTGRI